MPAYQFEVIAAAGPVSSWKGQSALTMILPFIEQTALYENFNFSQAWDEGNNGTLARTKLPAFLCPSDLSYPDASWGGVNYLLNGGSRRDFYSTGDPVAASGPFVRRRNTAFRDIIDGLSNVVLMSEILKGDADGTGLDMRRDFTNSLALAIDSFPTSAQIETAGVACDTTAATYQQTNAGRSWAGGFPGFVAFNTIAPPNWKHISCCTGGGFGYACDRNGIVPARSLHTGGVTTAMADGSVRFVTDSVNLTTWQRIGARADGEVVEVP